MTLRTLFARFRSGDTTQPQASDGLDPGSATRGAAPATQVDRRDAWRPTARSACGQHVQATQYRQSAIEPISQRGRERGIDPAETLAAMDHLDTELHARGWHPDQFPYDDEDPIDDFVNGVDVDYDPGMAAYDAQTAQRRTDADEA